MKKIFLFSVLTFTSLTLWAETKVYTSLSSSGESIFAGVKVSSEGEEPETYLLEVNSKKLVSGKVNLPSELSHREVVALIETKGENIVVVTQKTLEQGDDPLIHSYQPSSKKWNKLGVAKCMSFAKLEIKESDLSFHCVETNEKGEEVVRIEKVKISGVKLNPSSSLELPQTKVESKEIKAELLGESFDWKELKVSAKSQEKIFKP